VQRPLMVSVCGGAYCGISSDIMGMPASFEKRREKEKVKELSDACMVVNEGGHSENLQTHAKGGTRLNQKKKGSVLVLVGERTNREQTGTADTVNEPNNGARRKCLD